MLPCGTGIRSAVVVAEYLGSRTPSDLVYLLNLQLDKSIPTRAACPLCHKESRGGLPCIACLSRELARHGVPDTLLREATNLHADTEAAPTRLRRTMAAIQDSAAMSYRRRLANLVAEPPEHI